MDNLREKLKGKELFYFCAFSAVLLFVAAFLFDTPAEIVQGMKMILLSRDVLITDYFVLAGYGAAFFNAGLVLIIAMVLIKVTKLPYTGFTMASLFICGGFALWGKNPLNMAPILLGAWLYAKLHRAAFARYIYTALFASCLGPFVTEFAYILPFPGWCNILMAFVLGIGIGFAIIPLAIHTSAVHMGYSLFNVGFAAGTLAFIMYSVLKSFGLESQTVFIWQEGVHPAIAAGFLLYFASACLFGLWLEHGKAAGAVAIMRHPGRAVADFVMMDGPGNTLMNMGILGIAAEVYILCIGGDLSGPVLGCILTVFGFASFGAHLKNYLPVLSGLVLATFFTTSELADPAVQIAAMLVVGISPIAGEFGPVAGVAAGMLHLAIVMCTSPFYGGLNLYNNGFSAGWVALFMVPFLESFMSRFGKKK